MIFLAWITGRCRTGLLSEDVGRPKETSDVIVIGGECSVEVILQV
jgi:hypothetical protein